jgi:hypothetical protein
MRKSNLYFLYLAINLFLVFLMFAHASYRERTDRPVLWEKKELVKRLELTDLCLMTEASYTRHLSQADLHTPFQDYPLSLEHFPSGSLLKPPEAIKRLNEKLD